MKCPTCHSEIGTWSSDPILTPKGLSGENYIGVTELKGWLITEIQNMRRSQEEEYGISPKTQFSEINLNSQHWHKKYINELRISTEKILTLHAKYVWGISGRQELLYRYFNYDKDGNYMGTHKNEWTDVDPDNLPNLPTNKKIKIKAILIEELRHPIFLLEGLEYPGTGFLRRYVTLDLTNVYTTFNSGGSLSQGDTINFSSNFSIENTEVWWESFNAYDILVIPAGLAEGWNLSGSRGNITATIEAHTQIKHAEVRYTVQTDGTDLWHHKSGFEEFACPYTGEFANIDVYELGEEPDLIFQYFDGATGECENIEPIVVDNESASAGWTSFYIWTASKSDNSTDFSLFPTYTVNTQWIGDPPNINPAPAGYQCIKIGNGTPLEYWIAWNEKYKDEWWYTYTKKGYIGYDIVTVDLGGGNSRKYCNWGYSEIMGGAPIRAEYRKDNKTLVYTCNIS